MGIFLRREAAAIAAKTQKSSVYVPDEKDGAAMRSRRPVNTFWMSHPAEIGGSGKQGFDCFFGKSCRQPLYVGGWAMRRALIVANKWWETELLIATLSSAKTCPAALRFIAEDQDVGFRGYFESGRGRV